MRYFGAAIFFSVLISGCKKPENSLGLDVQPEEDALGLNQIDTITLITYTLREDSLRTDEFSRNVIGSYVDREMGTFTAATYFHLRTAAQNLSFSPDSITIDSVVLSLRYNSYYGNLNPQTFRVYRLTEYINHDSIYYSNKIPLYDAGTDWVEPGFETFTPDPFSTVSIGTDTAAPPQLRLRLKNALGDLFINASSSDLANSDAFVQFFNGLIVLPDNPSQQTEEGALLYFDLLDSYSKLTIYYRDTVNGEADTLALNFPISGESARITHSSMNYAGSQVEQHLNDTTLGETKFYVQALAGLKGAVVFPYLENLRDVPVVINKAELILPLEYYIGSSYFPVEKLLLVTLNDEGNEITLPDFFEGESHAGGFYDLQNAEYRFLITRYVQQVLSGTRENHGLRVLATEASVSGNRSVLNGPGTVNRKKPKLVISYTTY